MHDLHTIPCNALLFSAINSAMRDRTSSSGSSRAAEHRLHTQDTPSTYAQWWLIPRARAEHSAPAGWSLACNSASRRECSSARRRVSETGSIFDTSHLGHTLTETALSRCELRAAQSLVANPSCSGLATIQAQSASSLQRAHLRSVHTSSENGQIPENLAVGQKVSWSIPAESAVTLKIAAQ